MAAAEAAAEAVAKPDGRALVRLCRFEAVGAAVDAVAACCRTWWRPGVTEAADDRVIAPGNGNGPEGNGSGAGRKGQEMQHVD